MHSIADTTCAPMAAGKPKPIVPSEPEVMIERGCVHLMNWHAIIWSNLPSVFSTAPFVDPMHLEQKSASQYIHCVKSFVGVAT